MKRILSIVMASSLVWVALANAETKPAETAQAKAGEVKHEAAKAAAKTEKAVGKAAVAAEKGAKTAVAETKKAVEAPAAEPAEGKWTFDPAHSSAEFAVKHLMVSTVHGSFTDVTGEVVLDEKDIAKSKVNATIGVASINTNNKDRDAHLKSKDFFDADKFPKMTFVSTGVKEVEKGKYEVSGKLTIRNITKPVVLKIEELTAPVKNPFMPTWSRGVRATTSIERSKFGMKWNKAIEAGGVVVGDKVDITLNLELSKPRA